LIVLAPLTVAIMGLCLRLWGRPSAGNFDIAAFFLSPMGLAALVSVACVLLASLYFELSGLMRLLADHRVRWWEAFRGSAWLFPRLIQLGLLQVAIYLSLALPFLAGIGLAYWWFWHGKDLNGLIILKPPDFWRGVFIADAFVAAYAVIALPLFLRQLFALPILILEAASSGWVALRLSAERSRGTLRKSATTLAAWFVIQSFIAGAILGSLHVVLIWILSRSGASMAAVVLVTGTVLALQGLLSMLLSVLVNLSFAAVLLSLYRHLAPTFAIPAGGSDAPRTPTKKRIDFVGWQLAGGLFAATVAVVAASVWIARGLKFDEWLEITAHRAGAIAAPENTVAALKQAIVDRADWAEIDVQLTADKQIVVMHDIDLARVGGGNRRVDEASLAEIQTLDVGTPISPRFAGEHIPTLRQMLAAAGDLIRLNVELKPHDKDDAAELTRRVIEELHQTKMIPRCRLCSQSYESLQLARQLEPQLVLGYIEGAGVGDSTKLDVDFLMVKSSLATRHFIARAKERGKQVHPWTVNDPDLVASLLDAGAANLITDDPALMRSRLEQLRAMSAPERLLLRTAQAIAR